MPSSPGLCSLLSVTENLLSFWTDKWLHGQSIEQLDPHLFALVSKSSAKRCTVFDALLHKFWTRDLWAALTVASMSEYIDVRDLVSNVQLQPDLALPLDSTQPSLPIILSSLAQCSLNLGNSFGILGRWRSVNFSSGLLSIIDAGLQIDRPREVYLILLSVPYMTRKMIPSIISFVGAWLPGKPGPLSSAAMGYRISLHSLMTRTLHVWWMRILDLFPNNYKGGLNSLIILVALSVWKRRNDVVFNGAALNVQLILISRFVKRLISGA